MRSYSLTGELLIHGMPYEKWIRLTYDERNKIDPKGWPLAGPTLADAPNRDSVIHLQDEEEVPVSFNLIAKLDKKKCNARRCLEAPVVKIVGLCWDVEYDVPLCPRHATEAWEEFELIDVAGSMKLLTGEPTTLADLPAETVLAGDVPPDATAAQPPVGLAGMIGKGLSLEKMAESLEITVTVVRDHVKQMGMLGLYEESAQTSDDKLALETVEARDTLETAKTFTIDTQADLETVAEVLQDVKEKLDTLTANEKEITGPMNAALEKVRDLFRPAKTYYTEIRTVLKEKVSAFSMTESERNAAALIDAATATAAGDATATSAALAKVGHVSNVQGITPKKVWKFEITDADAVPRAFCSPVDKLIRAAVAEGIREIAGVRIYEDRSISVSAKK